MFIEEIRYTKRQLRVRAVQRWLRAVFDRIWSYEDRAAHPEWAKRLWRCCGYIIMTKITTCAFGKIHSRVYKSFEHGWVVAHEFIPAQMPHSMDLRQIIIDNPVTQPT